MNSALGSGRERTGGGGAGGGQYGGLGGGGRGRYNNNNSNNNSNNNNNNNNNRGRGGGRGGRFRHTPYNNNRNRGPRGGGLGGGGWGGRGNRFGGGGGSYQDQQSNMIRQIHSIVSRVGELKNIRDEDATAELRAVESTTARNVNDVTTLLCAPEKLNVLLKFQAAVVDASSQQQQQQLVVRESKPEEEFGQLVHLLVSCVGGLPLQTPCYAALTLAVHDQVRGGEWDGFAGRCVDCTMHHLVRDLDLVLLDGTTNKNQCQVMCRLKLMLRYLAILGRMNVVKGSADETDDATPSQCTVVGLLCRLVEAAEAAAELHNHINASCVLAVLVLSTLPYIADYTSADIVQEKLVQPLESLLQSYKSTFTPGSGITSILLREEQDDGDDDGEEDEDEEDDAGDEAGPICDSLQELLRAIQHLKKGEPTRFGLLVDAPWKGLQKQTARMDGEPSESYPVVYVEEPIYLEFKRPSEVLGFLLDGEGNFKLQCHSLEGIVFGRLPIFGSPPDPQAEEENDDGMDDALSKKNEHLQAFSKGYTWLDRFFVADALRDCIISHESCVAKTGTMRGSAKYVAEELLSICFVFSGENTAIGMEYAILETTMALLAQSSESGSLRHIYLSRLILELTRLQPMRLSPALAVAVTNLFQDYLPALVPTARENFSRWFSFHLINTDYQWPSGFWTLWEPFVVSDKTSSRGVFVKSALTHMADNITTPEQIVNQCFPSDSTLGNHLLGTSTTDNGSLSDDDSPIGKLEQIIQTKIWDVSEDPESLHSFLVEDEVTSSVSNVLDASSGDPSQIFWRTGVVIRVLLDPARQERDRLQLSIERTRQPDEDIMEDDGTLAKDAFSELSECVTRYHQVLSGAIAKDIQTMSDGVRGSRTESELIQYGEAHLLGEVESVTRYSLGMLSGLVGFLFQSKVVSGLGILRWALGDTGREGTVVDRWWFYAIMAVRRCVLNVLDNDSCKEDGGMVIDVGGLQVDEVAAAQAKATEVMKQFDPLLQYAVVRVCSLLASLGGGVANPKKKLTPLQVDLAEGVKTFAASCHSMLPSLLLSQPDKNGKALLQDDVFQMLENSESSGRKLASLCAGYSGGPAVDIVQRSLENL
jgi:hypothetical protein